MTVAFPMSPASAAVDEPSEEVKAFVDDDEPRPSPSGNQDAPNGNTTGSTPKRLLVLAMQAAVGSRVPEAVVELLQGMSEDDAGEVLTATYEEYRCDEVGVKESPDGADCAAMMEKDFLFAGASPILHAARCGNAGMFTTVLEALRARVSSEKFKEVLTLRDKHGRTPLLMAARSGCKDAFLAVLEELRRSLKENEKEQLMSMVQSMDGHGRSLLFLAARSGNEELFEAVLQCLKDELSNFNVKTMMDVRDRNGCSLLGVAALGGSKGCFNTVLDVLWEELSGEEIGEMMRSRDGCGRSLIALAALSGSKKAFAAVVNALVEKISKEEVLEMLKWKDNMNRSLLAQAAVGGKIVLEAARTALSGNLSLDDAKGEKGIVKLSEKFRNYIRFRPPSTPSENTLAEYRGVKKWAGLLPAMSEPRRWDEGFRSFLVKYGMINHIAYDVYVKPRAGHEDGDGHRGTSRFNNNLRAFTRKGLKFKYVNRSGDVFDEYDFTNDYHVIGNLVCNPRSSLIRDKEDNWFGFVLLSNDLREMVIVFRGTQSTLEWVMNAKVYQERLNGDERTSKFDFMFNQNNRLCHAGFQKLYRERSSDNSESPKETIYRLVQEHKGTLDFVTTVGHSLGGGMCQLCAIDLVNGADLGDVPVLAIAWGGPKVANECLAKWANSMHPRLRVLRVKNATDLVTKIPPRINRFGIGGYKHVGTPLKLSNEHLLEKKLVKRDSTNNSNHNLQAYLYNIDPTRDIALMNKYGDIVNPEYPDAHDISVMWHKLAYPRTIYEIDDDDSESESA